MWRKGCQGLNSCSRAAEQLPCGLLDVGRSSRSARVARKSRPDFVNSKDPRGVLGPTEKDESKQPAVAPQDSSGSEALSKIST